MLLSQAMNGGDGAVEKRIYLYPGALAVTTGPSVITTILGSCVAVCLWDPATGRGGMNHFILPHGGSQKSPRRGIAPQRIAVNVGAKHCHHPRLVEGVRQTLDRYGLLGSILEIEITETAAMQDLNATLGVIEELRAMGAEVAIDDFGTGHSSLSYLREFPITALKIDRSFVSDLPGSGAAGALVNAIMSTGKAFGLRIVAEGVETHAQLSWLRDAGCDEGQGFLFAKPVDAEERPHICGTPAGRRWRDAILDFGFWIARAGQSKIQNPK